MTSKERMMRALRREKPDRLPVTIHQWQPYHLREHMGGCDQIEAFLKTGLDASVTPFTVMRDRTSPDWKITSETLAPDGRGAVETRYEVETPSGNLTFAKSTDKITTFFTEHLAKSLDEVEIFLRHWPNQALDQEDLSSWYNRTGDAGIVRGFVSAWGQPGVWQDFVELVGTQDAIMFAIDEPDRVHSILDRISRQKVAFVHEQMRGAKYDLIEHGGGAASSTVISPAMFEEFCVPYDKPVIAALHECGFPVVYHTCGGMVPLAEMIPSNGCDASETLSPPGVGGDVTPESRSTLKEKLGGKVALIGGMDQFNILTGASPERIREEVRALFESFGRDGGYICSASDHFFDTPPENLRVFAEAAKECAY
ncbi:MAG: uroporphyrinogen decarboxylase family protein [Terrimicrobiaceae bacterium]